MEEHEIEEGESCYYKDDTSIDPDIALPYIDEKLQNVLGHFQKDFEGGVSAENLGAKFGGYGSFLLAYQRSPSVRSHPKTPPSIPKSPVKAHLEGVSENHAVISDVSLLPKHGTSSLGVHSLPDPKVVSADFSVKTDSSLLSAQVGARFPMKHEPSSSKSVNPTDQKPVRVRIKLGSDNATCKNAAIYSGLGLISPSSSMGQSPDGSGGKLLESQEIPDESPASIFQSMTSFPVTGGTLLSPLPESLLCLIRKENHQSTISLRNRQKDSTMSVENPASTLGKMSKEKKTKSVTGVIDETKYEDDVDFDDNMTSFVKKNMEAETPKSKQSFFNKLKLKLLSSPICKTGDSLKAAGRTLEVHREAEKDVPVKKRAVNRDWVKESLGVTHTAKDVSESMHSSDDAKYEQQAAMSSLVEQIGEHRVRISEKDVLVDFRRAGSNKGNRVSTLFKSVSDIKCETDSKSVTMNHLKNKIGRKGADNEHDVIKLPQSTKELSLEGKNKSKLRQSNDSSVSNSVDGSLRSGVSALKNKKRVQKDVANQMSTFERPSDDRAKGKNLETTKKKAPNDIPPTKGLSSEMELASVAPVYTDTWVQCDICETWRLLPYGTTPDQLPENWLCSMLDWLPGMNRCDISQDETDKALRALYQPALPIPESKNNFQNHAEGGATSAASQHSKQNHQNLCSDTMPNRGKKKLLAKETPSAGSNCNQIQSSSLSKNLQQDPFNATKQRLTGTKTMNHSNLPHLGARKRKKLEDTMESDKDGCKTTKRIKSEVKLHSDEYWNSENVGNFGRLDLSSSTGLPTRATGKDFQKHGENGCFMDAKCERENRILIYSKKLRDSTQVFSNVVSLDVKTRNERETFAKKRKLKDLQGSQSNSEILQSNSNHLSDGMVSLKEENGATEYRKEKKSRVSRTEGNESSTSKGDVISKKRGKVFRTFLSGRRGNLDNWRTKKDQQQQKHRVTVASQITLDDVLSLKKDLESEQCSAGATSNSSKVSDSRKRPRFQEVKGSPVESVSSSPMRISNLNNLSPTRRGISGKGYAKIGDSTEASGPRKSLECEGIEGNRTGVARKGKPLGAFQAESVGCLVLDIRGGDVKGKVCGKSNSNDKPSLGFRSNYLLNSDADTLHQLCPMDVHASDNCDREDRTNIIHNRNYGTLQQKSRKGSILRSEEKDRSSCDFQEVTVNSSDPLSEQEFNPKNVESIKYKGYVENHVCDGCSTKSSEGDKNLCKKGFIKLACDSQRENQIKLREYDSSEANLGDLCSVDGRFTIQQNCNADTRERDNPTYVELKIGKSHVNLCHAGKEENRACVYQPLSGSLKKNGFDVQPVEIPGDGWGGHSKVIQHPGHTVSQNVAHQRVDRDLIAPKAGKRDISSQAAANVLKEAGDLKERADHFKSSGFSLESNMTNFQAALKFLLGAVHLETSNNKSTKHGEMAQMQIYSRSAKLCETCAHEFEKRQEMAAAALAYKCMEVAYMRVVYCRSSSTNRDRHNLQANLHMVPQGDSPSSSASDLDNLNNQVMVDKAALSRGLASNAGSHVIVVRNRPNFVRVLDFTNEVSSAMEASRKSQIAFSAANVMLEEAQNKEGVVYVKRVIDFSYHDVEEFVRLVQLADAAINHQGFVGIRD